MEWSGEKEHCGEMVLWLSTHFSSVLIPLLFQYQREPEKKLSFEKS
jgi:hypothetical protein